MTSEYGMRPQDVVILLEIVIAGRGRWQFQDLASNLFLSPTEIATSLQRSHVAGLVDKNTGKVFRQSFMEFLKHGLHYVFPQLPGGMVTGVPTAHSHPFFTQRFIAEPAYVWPYRDAGSTGLSIGPLYAGAPKAALKDEQLHKLLAALDILRVGRTKEIKVATEELRKIILS